MNHLSKAWAVAWIVAAALYAVFYPITAISRTLDIREPVPLSFIALESRGAQMSSGGAPEEVRPPSRARMSFSATATGYSAEPAQTDDTPGITADGSLVHEGGVACPARFGFGVRVRIDGRVLVCNDRMAPRYRDEDRFDIFFTRTADAVDYGTRHVEVEVL